ncbi:hypothetical protein ACQP1U_10890 [Actinomycetota bacterium]
MPRSPVLAALALAVLLGPAACNAGGAGSAGRADGSGGAEVTGTTTSVPAAAPSTGDITAALTRHAAQRPLGLDLAALRYAPEGAATAGPDGSWRVPVRGEMQLRGYDLGTRPFAGSVTMQRRGGAWQITSESASKGGLWALPGGAVSTVTGQHSIVIGQGGRARLGTLAAQADRAATSVAGSWGRSGAEPVRLVVIAPQTADGARAALGVGPPDGVAAITDGPLPAGRPAPADRIVLMPDAFGALTPEGAQMVLTHETVHVAMRAEADRTAPLWLVEGLADQAGYAETGRATDEIAGSLLDQVRADGPPDRLPTDAELESAGGEALSRIYTSAWLAVLTLDERHGKGTAQRVYAATTRTASGTTAVDAVEAALAEVAQTTTAELTRQWRERLVELAGR